MADSQYVYAIVPRESPIPISEEGLEGHQLTMIVHRDLAAVCSLYAGTSIAPTPEHVLRHEAIVEAVREISPSLPVRFGTILADADAVTAALRARYDVLTADLERIGDKVELGITVLWNASSTTQEQEPAPNTDTRGAGADYLLRRVAEHRHHEAVRVKARKVLEELNGAIGPHVLDRRGDISPSPRVAVRATYLLDPTHVEDFKERFDRVRRAQPDLRFLLSGPWPPYSFVSTSGNENEDADRRSAIAG